MKKIMMTLAAVCVAATMNAQVWVGGDLGFGFAKANSDAKTSTVVTVSPQVGYMLNDKFGVYADLNFDSYKAGIEGAEALSAFGFDVAARYIFAQADKVSFFIDGGVGMNFFNKSRGSVFGIAFQPGIKFAATEKISLVARLGGLGAKFGNKKAQDAGVANKSEFGLDVNNSALTFGVYYNF